MTEPSAGVFAVGTSSSAFNREQQKTLIRFALSQLRVENGAHQFERICRNLAQQRIASNIVPATGPVAGRGDQGRDFETFPSYLESEGLSGASFIAMAGQRAAFACTLQQDDLRSKVANDAKTVMASGRAVERIYFFCERDVPVGDRHRWEEDVGSEVGAEIVIFDGNAIADMLAMPDTVWIAAEFLSLPAELLERVDPDAPADWYSETRAKWRGIERPAGVFAEFWDLRNALRFVTEDAERREDLPFWLGRADTYLQVAETWLARRIFYEIVVASLKGLGTLRGYEERLASYFDEALRERDASALEDAQVLLMFAAGAAARDVADLTDDQLASWTERLAGHIAAEVASAETAGRRAQLLLSLASLALTPSARDSPSVLEERIDQAMEIFLRLTTELDDAPLFPVIRFGKIVGVVAPLIADHPGYRELTRKIDELIASRSGRAAAAEASRDRAMAFYREGQLLAAIEEFHQARADWFAGDTLRGSLLATALLGHIYDRLYLDHAAKYYWLALAYVATAANDPSLLDFPAKALLAASQDDYRAGAFFGYLSLFDLGYRLHFHLDENAGNVEQEDALQAAYLSLLVTFQYLSERGEPALKSWLDELIDRLDLRAVVEELREPAVEAWGGSAEALAARFAEQLGSVPFADAGDRRVIRFSALGVLWEIAFANEYDVTVVAERFVAMIQIVLADLAREELALVPTPVSIALSVADAAATVPVPSNVDCRWSVALPAAGGRDAGDVQLETITPIASILDEISLLPSHELREVIESAFERGLTSKLYPAVTYDEAFERFVTEDMFGASRRRELAPRALPADSLPREHDALRWNSGPGPTYSREKAEEFLRNRYDVLIGATRMTLPRLLANEETRDLIAALREEGWLDWQVLSAIHSVAMNWRINDAEAPPVTFEERRERTKQFMEEESPTLPEVPLGLFTRDALTEAINLNLPAVLQTWELENRRRTPDLRAIGRFLDARYNHSADDVEHEDMFAAATRPQPSD